MRFLVASMKTLSTPGAIPALDGLRALAILLVLFTHIFQLFPNFTFVLWRTEWLTFLYNGWIGVDLFFVLSGFLIGSQLINNSNFSFSRFWITRFFRIAPTFYLILSFVAIAYYFDRDFFSKFGLNDFKSDFTLKEVFFGNFVFISNYITGNIGIGSWSLSIEEQFYLIAPLLIFLIKPLSFRLQVATFAFIVLLSLIFRVFTYRLYDLGDSIPIELVITKIYFSTVGRFDALASGMLCAIFYKKFNQFTKENVFFLRWISLIPLLFVFLTGGLKGGWYEVTLQYSLIAFGWSVLLLGIVLESNDSLIVRLLSHRYLTPIARISYSIYLSHILILHFVHYRLKDYIYLNIFFEISLILFLVLIISTILFLLFEWPIYSYAKNKILKSL